MQMKKIIINADDFGYSKENNEAIKIGYESEVITSASIMTNMSGFEDAVYRVIPQCPNLDIGFHFNIIEGKSLTSPPLLTDNQGFFNKNYLYIIANSKRKDFLEQIEAEFRLQIEKILKYHSISHIDSHVLTHAIPHIYKLIMKLAKEYNINYIRTQKEIPYFVWHSSFNFKYPVNILKNILLNYYTISNNKNCYSTNDYFIGILYTGMMDKNCIIKGLKKINKKNSITEIIFHPCTDIKKANNYAEFLITQDKKFKEELKILGFELTNYSVLESKSALV